MTNLHDIETPAVVLDWPVCRANIERMQAAANRAGVELRPHIKTHKMVPVAREQVRAGAAGLCTAKTTEAEAMLPAEPPAIFIAFPVWGPAKLERLAALADRVTVQTAVEGIDQAGQLAEFFASCGRSIDVLIEIDTGLHRTGVAPGEPARELARQLDRLDGIDVIGLFCHEGELGRQWPDRAERAAHADEPIEMLRQTKALLDRDGIRCDAVWPGSTPSAPLVVDKPGITAIRPGTYVFNDVACLRNGVATPADLAVTVHATVVARPGPDRLVIDAGSKTLAADRNPVYAHGLIVDHDELELVDLNEEHGWIRVKDDRTTAVQPGDRLRIVPAHICPCINLHETVHVVDDDRVIDRWPVAARGCVL